MTNERSRVKQATAVVSSDLEHEISGSSGSSSAGASRWPNMSVIYQYLGAKEEDIAWLWIAAPLTGLIVQPIVGYASDRTWTRLGRRRPVFSRGGTPLDSRSDREPGLLAREGACLPQRPEGSIVILMLASSIQRSPAGHPDMLGEFGLRSERESRGVPPRKNTASGGRGLVHVRSLA